MELGREPGIGLVANTLVRAVVHIYEERLPVRGQRRSIYGKTVILTGDVALRRANLLNRLVMTTMTILQLICLGTGSTSQQLVTQANTHQGLYLFIVQEGTDMLNRLAALLGVTRTIGQEQTVKLQLVEVVVPRYADNLYTSVQQTTNDVGLDAAIH